MHSSPPSGYPPNHAAYRQNSYGGPPTPQYYGASTPIPYNMSPPLQQALYSSHPSPYAQPAQPFTNHYTPPDGRRHSGTPSQPPAASNLPPARSRGHYSNLSWTPATGSRGGIQIPPRNRAASKPENAEEDDNPFRPSKELQAEDVSLKEASERKKEPIVKPETPPKEQADSKIKFALKGKSVAPSGVAPTVDLSLKNKAARSETTTEQRSVFTTQATPSVVDKMSRLDHNDGRRHESRYAERSGRRPDGRHDDRHTQQADHRYEMRTADELQRRSERRDGRYHDRRDEVPDRRTERIDERHSGRRDVREEVINGQDERRSDSRYEQHVTRENSRIVEKPREQTRTAGKSKPREPERRIIRRLKPRPELSEELAASDSVYYRKPGNESVVGAGTYGKVFRATHVYTGSRVALKRIRMEGERDGVSFGTDDVNNIRKRSTNKLLVSCYCNARGEAPAVVQP